MRFLVDENLSPRICPVLAAGAYILLTADRGDFGRRLALTRAPSVVLLRHYPTSSAQPTSRLFSSPTSPTW